MRMSLTVVYVLVGLQTLSIASQSAKVREQPHAKKDVYLLLTYNHVFDAHMYMYFPSYDSIINTNY